MDYIDPANSRLPSEPASKLTPEQVEAAAVKYQADVLNHLNSILLGLPSTLLLPDNEKNNSRFN